MNTISNYNPSMLLSQNLAKQNYNFTSNATRWDFLSQPSQDIFQKSQPQENTDITFAGQDGEEDVYYVNGVETRVNAGTSYNTVDQSVNGKQHFSLYA